MDAPAHDARSSKDSDALTRIIMRAQDRAGLSLEAKREMVRTRLSRRLRQLDLDLLGYAALLDSDQHEEAVLLDLLATSHTAWWREAGHFTHFQERLLTPLVAQPAPRLRVWCAAAASGEEPYSLALCVHRILGGRLLTDAAILATDLSHSALAQARLGRYGAEAVLALSPADRAVAFEPRADPVDGAYVVAPCLRALLRFAQLNLMAEWPMSGVFDAIFCRNVLFYVTPEARARLVARLCERLRPGGFLYIGMSESLSGIIAESRLAKVGPSVYARP